VSVTRFELTFEHVRCCASCARLNARAAVAAAQPLRPSIVDVSGTANEKRRTGTVRFRAAASRAAAAIEEHAEVCRRQCRGYSGARQIDFTDADKPSSQDFCRAAYCVRMLSALAQT
jgi:hypothetical protein